MFHIHPTSTFYSNAVQTEEVFTLANGRLQDFLPDALYSCLIVEWQINEKEELEEDLKSSAEKEIAPDWCGSKPCMKVSFLFRVNHVAGWPCPRRSFIMSSVLGN